MATEDAAGQPWVAPRRVQAGRGPLFPSRRPGGGPAGGGAATASGCSGSPRSARVQPGPASTAERRAVRFPLIVPGAWARLYGRGTRLRANRSPRPVALICLSPWQPGAQLSISCGEQLWEGVVTRRQGEEGQGPLVAASGDCTGRGRGARGGRGTGPEASEASRPRRGGHRGSGSRGCSSVPPSPAVQLAVTQQPLPRFLSGRPGARVQPR